MQEKFIMEKFFKGEQVFKFEKISGPPAQQVRYLGIIINSVTMNFEIPEDKLAVILEEASFLLKTKLFLVKRIAYWFGKLQSLRLVISPIVSIM